MFRKDKPRMYWACTHVPLRYEEVEAAIDAGFEVIPALGSLGYLPFEQRYDDENWSLYPEWRASCSLPVNVCEAIRRVALDGAHLSEISDEEKKLFNKYIDVIYIPSFPQSVAEVLGWFSGLVIFRSFGRISNFSSYSALCETNGIQLRNRIRDAKFLFLPIFSSLIELEEPWMTQGASVLRGFVSESRLPFKWLGGESPAYISTIIKADTYEANSSVEERFLNLKKIVGTRNCVVLGKNQRGFLENNIEITGFLDHSGFYSQIAQSRVFVYLGDDSYHLHFTPLEAIAIGVPVLFFQSSPLAQELLKERVIEASELTEIGALRSCEEISLALDKIFDDCGALARLASRQAEAVLKVFSRQRAVASFQELISRVPKRKSSWFSEAVDHVKPRRHPNRLKPNASSPHAVGQYAILNPEDLSGNVGEIVDGAAYGVSHPVREMLGINVAGGFLGTKYFSGVPGRFCIEITLIIAETHPEPVAYLEVGKFEPDYGVLSRKEVVANYTGKHCISLEFELPLESEKAVCELRLFSLAKIGLVFVGGIMKIIEIYS